VAVLIIAPASAGIVAGGSQSYTATGLDQYGNSLGDVTAATVFSIAPNGSCSGAGCTATVAGSHTVTAQVIDSVLYDTTSDPATIVYSAPAPVTPGGGTPSGGQGGGHRND